MRKALALLLLCTVLLACIYSASADYLDEFVTDVAEQKRQHEQWQRRRIRPKTDGRNATAELLAGLGDELKGYAENCRASGCRDVACCYRRQSVEFQKNPLVMQILKEQWIKLVAPKDEL